jgi:hypothetical protein
MSATGEKAGHGALIFMEKDPVGAQGTFTTIGLLSGDITRPAHSHPETDVTPHQANDDRWVMSPKRAREAITFQVTYDVDASDGTHDELETGYYVNTCRGFKIVGPADTESANPGAETDNYIGSGYLQAFTNVAPVGEGAYTADMTVRFTGPHIRNGVLSTAIT